MKEDFSRLRTFGCRVHVRAPGKRSAKFRTRTKSGIFLGYLPDTTKNILWYDEDTGKVKVATHARFDEGMNDLPIDQIPPNVQLLQRSEYGKRLPAEEDEVDIPEFSLFHSPFSKTIKKTLRNKCDDKTYGINVASDQVNNRAFVHEIFNRSSAHKMFSTQKALKNIIGAYIVSIDNKPIFTAQEATLALRAAKRDNVDQLPIEFAPERRLYARERRKVEEEHNWFTPDDPSDVPANPIAQMSIDDYDETHNIPSITISDLQYIASIRYPELDFSEESIPTEVIEVAINAIRSDAIIPEEQALGRFTRYKLKKLSTWDDWQAGERKQLDQFECQKLYGAPVDKPPGSIVLRPHWQYAIKRDGTRQSRNCCDGSPCAAPILHGLISTYSSCVEQPIQRLFMSLSTALGYRVYGGDALDAYAHSPPPVVPTYVSIDDAYAEWYQWKHGHKIDRSKVLPVQHALQGHPESGKLWEQHINKILFSSALNFKCTTHDRTIYSTVFKGVKVLLL